MPRVGFTGKPVTVVQAGLRKVQLPETSNWKITSLMLSTTERYLLSLAPSQLEYTPIAYKKHAQAHAEKVLGSVSAAAKLAGVGCETLHSEHEHVYQAIIEAAASRRCDLIVMASHGRRGVSAVVLGS